MGERVDGDGGDGIGQRPAALSARGVSFAPGGVDILADVSFDVHPGELVALLGPNGAGKSTALAALAGDLKLDAGRVLIHGRELSQVPVAELGRLRSVLAQRNSIAFSYSVREVVEMGRLPWRAFVADDEQIVADALHRADVTALADRDVTTLSGGEQARVALARVLAQNCATVLLDEPTAALDIGHQEQVLQIAATLASEGSAVLVVLHDLNLAAAYASRIVVMDAARVVANGTPQQVLTSELLSEVYRYPIEVTRHPHTGELLIWPKRQGTPAEGGAQPAQTGQRVHLAPRPA